MYFEPAVELYPQIRMSQWANSADPPTEYRFIDRSGWLMTRSTVPPSLAANYSYNVQAPEFYEYLLRPTFLLTLSLFRSKRNV